MPKTNTINDDGEGPQKAKRAVKNRKRGQGEGSIYKRQDGLWAGAINLGYQGGKLKRKVYYGKTRSEVSEKLTAALRDSHLGIQVVTDQQNLKEFLTGWLEDSVKPSVRRSTYVSYEQQVRVHIVPQIGHIKLSKLSPQHITAYINGRIKSGLSHKTAKYHLTLLRMALSKAEKWGLISRNPAMLVDPPRVPKYEIQPITQDQAKAFLKAIEGDRMEALFTVALSLGLRRGEALGLRWSDVDLQAKTLVVNQALQRLEGSLQLTEPKTKSSRRMIDLPESLISKLREHRTKQLEEKLKLGQYWQESGLVFTSRLGTAVDPRNVKRRLDPLLKKAGLPHYRVHDLRHFCASLLLAQGVPLKVVSELLGHSQISMTADLYTHVLPSLRKQAVDLMDSLISGTK